MVGAPSANVYVVTDLLILRPVSGSASLILLDALACSGHLEAWLVSVLRGTGSTV